MESTVGGFLNGSGSSSPETQQKIAQFLGYDSIVAMIDDAEPIKSRHPRYVRQDVCRAAAIVAAYKDITPETVAEKLGLTVSTIKNSFNGGAFDHRKFLPLANASDANQSAIW